VFPYCQGVHLHSRGLHQRRLQARERVKLLPQLHRLAERNMFIDRAGLPSAKPMTLSTPKRLKVAKLLSRSNPMASRCSAKVLIPPLFGDHSKLDGSRDGLNKRVFIGGAGGIRTLGKITPTPL
jgi:hypothetical protein